MDTGKNKLHFSIYWTSTNILVRCWGIGFS